MSKKARQEGRTDRASGKNLSDSRHKRYGGTSRKGIIFSESDKAYEERQTKRDAYTEGYRDKEKEEKEQKKKG